MNNSGHEHETEKQPKVRAIAATSGGLDSLLAAAVVRRAGIDVTLLHVQHLFSTDEEGRARIREQAERANLPLRIVDRSAEHLETVRRPKHGYGQGMNPCVDCRVFMLKVAKQVMEEEGAQFVVTGEVLGQRPKSQHYHALLDAAEESGLGDRLLRPLSARLLPETLPIREGWLSLNDLPTIHGRSRQQQMALAQELSIDNYPQPAGGCILIEKTYAARLRDAFAHVGKDAVGVEEFRLLEHGRHFRLSEDVKVIIGRNQAENEALEHYASGRIRIDPVEVMGPTALIEGNPSKETLGLICSLVARYCDHAGADAVRLLVVRDGETIQVDAAPLDRDDPRIGSWRIGD